MCRIINKIKKKEGGRMITYFPGTVVERHNKTSKEFLFGVFSSTKGLILAQVREITGLDTPAIQNWINRGWVQKPVEKRYSINHLARILIINMLRDVMKLEDIAALTTYINGNTEDITDDIITESRLYNYVCDILDHVDYDVILTETELRKVITDTICDYEEPQIGARDKLINGLEIILVYYAAAIVKVRADKIYNKAINKK